MKPKSQRGVTVALVALFIVVLFVFAALAVDVGLMYTARTSTQHVADAAALAGAYTFENSTADQPTAATNAALAMADGATALGKPVTLTVVDVTHTSTRQTITVEANASVPLFFARVIELVSAPVKTQATAERATVAGGTGCLKPFYVLNSQGQFDKDGNCTKPLLVASAPTKNWTLPIDITVYSQKGAGPSNWDLINPNSFDGSMAGGCTGVGGAKDVDDAILGCFAATCQPGLKMCKANGGKSPPKVQNNVDEVTGLPRDTFLDINQYESFNGVISDTSRSIVTAVIWDDCGECAPKPGYSDCGKTGFPVAGYAKIFITGTDKKLVTAKLLSYASCGADQTGSGGTGPYAVPIRLVHPEGQ